jgi:hypothetical protein
MRSSIKRKRLATSELPLEGSSLPLNNNNKKIADNSVEKEETNNEKPSIKSAIEAANLAASTAAKLALVDTKTNDNLESPNPSPYSTQNSQMHQQQQPNVWQHNPSKEQLYIAKMRAMGLSNETSALLYQSQLEKSQQGII